MAESQDSPLSRAISRGDAGEIRSLVDAGAELNQHGGLFGWTPLIHAAYSDQLDAVNLLIQAGADLNLSDDSGNTALMTAARKERREIVAALIQAGANCAIVNNSGKSASDLSEDGVISDLIEKAMADS